MCKLFKITIHGCYRRNHPDLPSNFPPIPAKYLLSSSESRFIHNIDLSDSERLIIPTMGTDPSLVSEMGPDGLVRESPVIAHTERMIEEEQLQLRKYIQENYSKIRDVERELSNLTMEMKLTAGPKKAALEHMRKKIELSTERIRVAKLKEEEAKKALEAASKVVKDEEALKQKLCEDLNSLVQESSSSQFARLEELKRRLEALNPRRSSAYMATAESPSSPALTTTSPDMSVPNTVEPPTGSSKSTVPNHSAEDSHNQKTVGDVEGRGKKKNAMLGRGKGIGAVPKGRGSTAGWTGSGFDVDGRP